MRPIRTSKLAASRVDPSYVRRPRRGALVLLTVLALIASVAWWALHQTRGNAAIYSPGHVASAHAQWDTNCAQCHDGDGRGGFLKHVSDSACLKCHQDTATAHDPHQSTMVQPVSMAHGHALLSANCAECHVEHRGHEALLDRTDNTCVQCHRDVAKFTNGTPEIQPSVTRFATGTHPNFGRELIPSKPASPGAMLDPTPLIFSHKDHMGAVKPREGQTENCNQCHELPAPSEQGVGINADKRYMKPVNYEKHCAQCHKLQLVPDTDTPIPHVAMAGVRPLLDAFADREGYFRRKLAAMTPEQQKNELVQSIVKTGPAPTYKKTTTTVSITPDQWVARQTKPFWDYIRKWYTDDTNQLPGLDETKTMIAAQTEFPAELKTKGTLEFFITHAKDVNDNKCALCHKLSDNQADLAALRESAGTPMAREIALAYRSGSLPGISAPTTSESAPTTQPLGTHYETLPTGISTTPRRWYVNSVFDHSAHQFDYKEQRAIGCLECHAKALASEQMTEVLLPGIESCVKCHHAADKTGPGAVDSCLACHPFYHDRSMEHSGFAPTLSAMLSAP